MNRTLRLILLACAGVVAVSAVIVIQQWIIMPKMGWDSVGVVMLFGLIDWSVWALLTPLIIWGARRAPMFRNGRPRPAIALHLFLGVFATAIWSIPIALIAVVLTYYGFDGAKPLDYGSAYLLQIQGRSFYYSLFYWLVVGIVTARQLARDAQEVAAEAARLESEALAADLQAARVHYDPRGLALALREAAALTEADPQAAEEHILETSGELQRSLVLSSPVATRRPLRAALG